MGLQLGPEFKFSNIYPLNELDSLWRSNLFLDIAQRGYILSIMVLASISFEMIAKIVKINPLINTFNTRYNVLLNYLKQCSERLLIKFLIHRINIDWAIGWNSKINPLLNILNTRGTCWDKNLLLHYLKLHINFSDS